MREPLPDDRATTYNRPNQDWVCGLTDCDGECPVGPTASGQCPQVYVCHPVRDGDRWRCNRSVQRGGPCDEGPTPEGECCLRHMCQPLRSHRAQRGRWVRLCLLATVGALLVALSSSWRNEFLAPGEVTVHHAQLIARPAEQTKRCASCHVAGNQTALEWLAHATNSSLASPSQNTLCLDCHQQEISAELAPWAHNILPEVLLTSYQGDDQPPLPAGRRRIDPRQPLPCSTCHREHHGAEHNLSLMSDSACQACHREQYSSFAGDHPEFTAWPERRRTRIAFDHHLHQTKHFLDDKLPEQKPDYVCALCHQADSMGSFQQTLSYEQSCALCHDSKVQTSWQTDLPVVALPIIDTEALASAGHDLGTWPESATGDFDGSLPVITKLLILSDPQAAVALGELGGDFDFFDIDPDDAKQLGQAAAVLQAAKQLIADLQTTGHAALAARLKTILGRELDSQELAHLAAHLSAEDLTGTHESWFGSPAAAAPREPVRNRDLVGAGGWYRDDLTLSLRYRPQGHLDVWVKSWIDTLAEATGGEHRAVATQLLTEMMKPTAPGMCGSCHSVDRTPDGPLHVNWLARRADTVGRQFTFFSHAPHVLQAELADCATCHQANTSGQVMETYQAHDTQQFAPGFHHLTKQSCTECHTSAAAGDRCTQCHRYHVEGD